MTDLVPTRVQRVDGVWTTVHRRSQAVAASAPAGLETVRPAGAVPLPTTREQALQLLGDVEMTKPDFPGAQRRVWRRGNVIIKLERWDHSFYNKREWLHSEHLRTEDVDFEVPAMRYFEGTKYKSGLAGDILVAEFIEGEEVHEVRGECDCPEQCWVDAVEGHLEDKGTDNVLRRPDDTFVVIDLGGPM